MPVNKRLSAVRTRALYLLARVQEIKKAEILKKAQSDSNSAREAAAIARMELQREFREVKEDIFKMTRVDLLKIYRGFFESTYYFEAGKAFGLSDSEIINTRRYAIDNINNRFVNYEDSSTLTYLKCVIDEIPDTTGIKHVVIDEAQDYSPLQYEVFRRLFPQSSFTILGDTNQLINPYRKSMGFERMTKVFGRDDSAVLRLSKAYRSTKEITEFTRSILPSDIQIEGLNRPGDLPEITRLDLDSDIKMILAEEIKRLLAKGMKSIAILCKTSEDCRFLHKLLSSEIELGMVIKDEDLYKKGVNVLPSYFSKGLEFDAVLVYGADERNYHTEGDRNLLYTLCTRALHILKIYYEGSLSPIISEINGILYKKS
jgi:DNA helicase-2/ATP-dependent DNA helicase PcrA